MNQKTKSITKTLRVGQYGKFKITINAGNVRIAALDDSKQIKKADDFSPNDFESISEWISGETDNCYFAPYLVIDHIKRNYFDITGVKLEMCQT